MVAVKMGGPMPPMPMGGMPQPLNPLPSPMPVPPMQFGQQPVGALPAQAAGTAPVAPIMRSNAGRRKRFGDSLEGMLATTRPPMVASDQMAGMNVFTGQMPRGQMMGGTAMQPPVRRMMGGGSVPVPRQTDIYGQPHMLAYINPTEASLLEGLGGMGTPGPGGVPQYNFFTDFINAITGGGKSSNTGGRNDPRGGSSNKTSTSTSNANKAFADSMKAGGGGTNLSGSGSSAMADLVAAQRAETQRDSGPGFDPSAPPDTGGYFDSPKPPPSKPSPPSNTGGYDEVPVITPPAIPSPPPSYDPVITPPSTNVGAPPNTGVIGGYDPIGGGSSDDPFYTPPPPIIIDDTPPEDITGSFPSPGTGGGDDDDSGINLTPPEPPVIYYDIDGNPHSTQAAAAEANRLINQRKIKEQQDAINQAAMDEANRLQGGLNQVPSSVYGVDELSTVPFNNANVTPTSLPDELIGVPFNTTQERVVNALQNFPDELTTTEFNNTGLADPNATKGTGDKKDGEDDDDDRSIVQKFVDDVKAVPGNIVRDIRMGIDAGMYRDLDQARINLRNAKNPDGSRKYTDAEIDSWVNATRITQERNKQQTQGQSTDDDGGSATVVDPCPPGMRLDPVSKICVPVDEEGEGEDKGPSYDLNRTRDDEFSELDDIMSQIVKPIGEADEVRTMQRGGSVGLNRAADNFLAAMGA
jgi:hypothetical protein